MSPMQQDRLAWSQVERSSSRLCPVETLVSTGARLGEDGRSGSVPSAEGGAVRDTDTNISHEAAGERAGRGDICFVPWPIMLHLHSEPCSSSGLVHSPCSPATPACCALQVADKLLKLCQGNGGVYIKMGQFLASLQAIPQEIRQ